MTIRTELPGLSELFQSPYLRAVFAAAEGRDLPPAAATADRRPAPSQPPQGAAATRELELA
jgi:hypothetical protein